MMSTRNDVPLWQHERDACGVGFIFRPDGGSVIADTLSALACMEHRGACGADGESGDGSGILTAIPWSLLAGEGYSVEKGGSAVGVIYVPEAAEIQCRTSAGRIFELAGFQVLGWRSVPVDRKVLGELALSTCPKILQLILQIPEQWDELRTEQRLMTLRKQLINYLRYELGVEDFYIASLSTRTIVYKAMVRAPVLGNFYADLRSAQFQSNWAVFHRRFSTNTFPKWSLAQPFRMLAHNGEINTLIGNRNWMRAREPVLDHPAWSDGSTRKQPIIYASGSDSGNLDNVAEMLLCSGSSLDAALMQLMPEAHRSNPALSEHPEISDFYDYYAALQEPWDGPALVVYSDGRNLGAIQDRNGLRPCRYTLYESGAIALGSEAGFFSSGDDTVVEKGRLGPGEMISIDLESGVLRKNLQIKSIVARRHPYADWLKEKRKYLEPAQFLSAPLMPYEDVLKLQQAFGYGKEDLEPIIETMAQAGAEPVFSMGDDTPLAVLSQHSRVLFDYFKQRFAQVTNPPIDPLRERLVMSLDTYLGCRSRLLQPGREGAENFQLRSPILNEGELNFIEQAGEPFRAVRLPMLFDAAGADLDRSLAMLCNQAEEAVRSGLRVLILSDRGACAERATIPALLAVGAVHYHLIREGLRLDSSIIVETGQCWNTHQFACLIGYGAQAICPYLAFESVRHWFFSGKVQEALLKANDGSTADGGTPPGANERLAPYIGLTSEKAQANFRTSVEEGLLKVMSKMGISALASYTGAQIFECIGLGPEIVHRCFEGTVSRIGGLEVEDIAAEALRFHVTAFPEAQPLRNRGTMNHRPGGEYHGNNPVLVRALHAALGINNAGTMLTEQAAPGAATSAQEAGRSADDRQLKFNHYSELIRDRPPMALRDLLEFNSSAAQISVDEVESVESIVQRFCTGGMSLGALSKEAHEVLAIAMNRLGAKSNSGEGGEDPLRYYPIANVLEDGTSPQFPALFKLRPGDNAASAIRQVASARFGVTTEYLVTAKQLEIKIAQGAKPGEGGQLPGHKVSPYIASLRKAKPGMPLISPPPHHDIYSIEDLAQLIFDLRQVNPDAHISVKLVAGTGIGTIAAGVAKANADIIQISGHDGGTGASPLSSIKNSGIPWELGLAEVHQVLIANNLRDRVLLRVDGGLRSGWEVVVAAMLGADEFGFGTIALMAAGCIMARICHTNNCPVGITSQKEALRKRFHGTPEPVVDFFIFMAEEVRLTLAQLGYRSLSDVIGRSDLLKKRALPGTGKCASLDLGCLLMHPGSAQDRGWLRQSVNTAPHKNPPSLDDTILRDGAVAEAITRHGHATTRHQISNGDRSVGAKLSGGIVSNFKGDHFRGSLILEFHGSAGQSFGAFNATNVTLKLIGEANDYVGKGMCGGRIEVRPPDANFGHPPERPSGNVIVGNTCLYGATGGAFFAAGRAGERFAVRNSGVSAVIEGAGDHCCEYMTGGTVVVLGSVGRNFGAGMTGGIAYVLDDDSFLERFNNDGGKLLSRASHRNSAELKALIEDHLQATGSPRAADILANWDEFLPHFWMVVPKAESETLLEKQEPEAQAQTSAA